jgi:AraC-like DNA-binding protein
MPVPHGKGRLLQVCFYGVFAACADPGDEPGGAIGATLSFLRSKNPLQRMDIIQGRHYSDARDLTRVYRPVGDGSCIETVGSVLIDGLEHRVDRLSVSLPPQMPPDRLVFADMGTPASFLLFDVVFQFDSQAVCPFRGHSGQIGLHELPSILRLKDWPRYEKALQQLESSILFEDDLDEGRGVALTFLSSLLSAQMDIGGDRRMHRFLLQAARSLDLLGTKEEIAAQAVGMAGQVSHSIFGEIHNSAEALIHRALAYMDRHFSEDLTDAGLADRVGLSNSHFRHLFKQVTKQPFHKYLLSLRLEKAKEMLFATELTIHEIAERTGFASPAHFSRAFSARFGAPPTSLRTGRSA